MKNIFTSIANAKVRSNDIAVRYHKSVSYNDKSLKVLGTKIWYQLPWNIKSEISKNTITHVLGLNLNVASVGLLNFIDYSYYCL